MTHTLRLDFLPGPVRRERWSCSCGAWSVHTNEVDVAWVGWDQHRRGTNPVDRQRNSTLRGVG